MGAPPMAALVDNPTASSGPNFGMSPEASSDIARGEPELKTRVVATTASGWVLSIVFATLLVGISTFDLAIEQLRVDPALPAPVTLRLPPTTFQTSDPVTGQRELHTIAPMVRRGEITIDASLADMAQIYEAGRRPPRPTMLAGLWLVYLLAALTLTRYMRTFSPSRGGLLRTQLAIFALMLFMLAATKAFLLLTPLSSFLLPAAALPLWVSINLDRRTGFIVSVTSSVLIASMLNFSLATIAVHLASGVAASLLLWDRKHLTVYTYGGLTAALAALVIITAGKLLSQNPQGTIDIQAHLSDPLSSDIVNGVLGGLLSGVLAFALRTPVVLLLGTVSRSRLLDLTDLDHPLLKRMAEKAPGSWEHARAMANLAEEAAYAIGADGLLTRVGAYFHDLGKTIQPKMFIENLERGEQSPHEAMEAYTSARAIMEHVAEGTKILRHGRIPEPVVEFAYTHHGTTTIEYFWHKYLKQNESAAPGQPILGEHKFKYPGMKPRSKETAVLMLVDSIEAAARTINPPERGAFETMVHRVIFTKLKQGQLDECNLTIENLHTLATKLVDTLVNIYHSRIRYPWQNEDKP